MTSEQFATIVLDRQRMQLARSAVVGKAPRGTAGVLGILDDVSRGAGVDWVLAQALALIGEEPPKEAPPVFVRDDGKVEPEIIPPARRRTKQSASALKR